MHRGGPETEDTQVQAELTDIASHSPATIATVSMRDSQSVHRGQQQMARSEASSQRSQADSRLNAAHAAQSQLHETATQTGLQMLPGALPSEG